ncbi:MAG: penicillin-insensitive murein endopeptidase [Pseudomonadota bacterium]
MTRIGLGLLGALWMLLASPSMAQQVEFADIPTPAPGPAQSIGTYTNGCFTGGEMLPIDGAGYQVIRISRNRNWGHPALIDFLEDLGQSVAREGLGVALVADMNQPMGGPITGHASHELGLDADIWLRLDLPRLSANAREQLGAITMVDTSTNDWRVTDDFTLRQAELIRLAASDPRVGRIFVHPAIKQAMCEIDWPDRSFLQTVRPWYGHDSHMHVRINCPANNPQCRLQSPPPAGDGCGAELQSWFPDPNRPPPPPAGPRPPPPPLPAGCLALLGQYR